MKPGTIKAMQQEAAAVATGKIAPGRVWVVTKRDNGTFERRQVDPQAYQRRRAKAVKAAAQKM